MKRLERYIMTLLIIGHCRSFRKRFLPLGLCLMFIVSIRPTPGHAFQSQDFVFQAAVSYRVVSGPNSVSIGDFNGEGRLDPAVANRYSDSVSNLLNMAIYYRDEDGDGYGDPNRFTQADSLPAGHVTNGDDCNDTDSNEHPGQTWYKDSDNDGYSDGTANTISCLRPVGYKTITELTSMSKDCKDDELSIYPDNEGVCLYDSSIILSSGWNLISLPLRQADTDIESVLSSIVNKYESVWAYINGGWYSYDPGQPFFSDLSTLEAGIGYWIKMNEPAELLINGSDPSRNISLSDGWNLVGYNETSVMAVDTALDLIAGQYHSIWAYVNGQWKSYNPNQPFFSDLSTLTPGMGYWIKASEASTWILIQDPDIDNDGDGFSENQGDCNDEDNAIYAGATGICGDAIDQNCTGWDEVCPTGEVFAFEDFRTGPGDFYVYGPFYSSGGQFIFHGDRSASTNWTPWVGGNNPSSNWFALPGDSNYFNDFYVSLDTSWDAGDDGYSYGLLVSISENNSGSGDYIAFMFSKDGYYLIYKIEDNEFEVVVDWTRSFRWETSGIDNNISIEKEGNNFRFYVNGTEIERLVINGFEGGGIGIIASNYLDISFDNFKVTAPAHPSGQNLQFPDYSLAEQAEFVFQMMTSSYLWYDRVPNVDYASYTSPEKLLDDLMYKELDKWSYITSVEEYESFFEEGKYIGVGFGFTFDLNNEIKITFVYENSPADEAGLMRGDRILAINRKSSEEIENNDLWDTIFGEDEIGILLKLEVEDYNGTIKEYFLTKESVTINTVLHHDILNLNGLQIGYLVFKSFLETSREELKVVFNDFKNQEIDELIIDLRYNGGGRIYISSYLAGLIKGTFTNDQIFTNIVHNKNFSEWNSTIYFNEQEQDLNLNRVFIITTESTCSASELLINGLQPYLNVIQIGDTTCGKPVGMYGYDLGEKHLSAIEFETVNNENEGGYFDGLSPTCSSNDDLDKMLGDTEEASLEEALYYILNNQCSITVVPKSILGIISPVKVKTKTIELRGFRREIGAF